ncbi:hypothetical protein GCM10007301_32020 [Azorhizobium oxalatiphilum]|uniref:Glycosyltransferase 2-like domain-containing protein n=1 Tax=Azorhizobium oxalatiphilum TaxID=980631 RepID=A0A917C3F1_9HYPH|nr:glycosyltransferase [Azorhizobium oxalatiphilum]GGF69880.1 hypothetical protein GCM10007301_32020 [Azorhizobium oxalatiphilum]
MIAVPAREEAARIGACIRAIARQTCILSSCLHPLFGVVVLVNNSADNTFAVAAEALQDTQLPFICLDVELPKAQAHAGGARGLAMDMAADWLEEGGHGQPGFILTTDADSRVPSDWMGLTQRALACGAGAVAGRVRLDDDEEHHLPADLKLRRCHEQLYEQVLLELSARIDPVPHDPWPNHGTASGASLAVTLAAYRAAGGLPDVPCGEDRALVDALRARDIPVRHASEIVVTTSARLAGRAKGGFADTMRRRSEVRDSPGDDALEPLANAVRRYAWRRRLRKWHAGGTLGERVWAQPLRLPATVEEQAREGFGAFWRRIEAASPILAKAPLHRDLLAAHAAAGRRFLDGLDDVYSRSSKASR